MRDSKFSVENRSIFESCYREWMNNRKNIRTKVSRNENTSIRQAEVAKNPENHNKQLVSAITEFEQVQTTDKNQFIPKEPHKQLD